MLSKEDNERLTRVGPGTPMGEMLREFWTPALRSAALEADGAPKRVRLLGENFVAFRATDGRVGFFQENCPHRGVSLALARNEENGLRCIFHGWKFTIAGQCIDTPTEPAERRGEFCKRVPLRALSGARGGRHGLGLSRPPRDAAQILRFRIPPSARRRAGALRHRPRQLAARLRGPARFRPYRHAASQLDRERRRAAPTAASTRFATRNTAPRFEIVEKPYGFREAALRDLGDGTVYARIREVVFPYYSFIPGDHGEPRLVVVVVPIDDEWSAHWYYYMNPFGPVPDWYATMGGRRHHAERRQLQRRHGRRRQYVAPGPRRDEGRALERRPRQLHL